MAPRSDNSSGDERGKRTLRERPRRDGGDSQSETTAQSAKVPSQKRLKTSSVSNPRRSSRLRDSMDEDRAEDSAGHDPEIDDATGQDGLRAASGRRLSEKVGAGGRSSSRLRQQPPPRVVTNSEEDWQEAADVPSAEMADTPSMGSRPLIDCVELIMTGDELLVKVSLDDWIRQYKLDGAKGLVDLANFTVHAAGLRKVHLDLSSLDHDEIEDPIEELFTEEKLIALVETAEANGSYVEPYPIASRKTGKKYKAAIIRVVTLLVEKIKHEILFDDKLMPWFIEWLMILSMSHARAIRHTGCEIAMELMAHLASITSQIQGARGAKERLKSGKRRKDAMCATLNEDAEKLVEQETCAFNMMMTIFEQVFIHRYRDTCAEIRAACVTALGKSITELPSLVSDQQLKYLGWILNDLQSAHVRVIALQSLHAIYRVSQRDPSKLNNFTSRFQGRLYEMIKDTDRNVSIEAIKLVTLLQQMGMLTSFSQTRHAVLQMMCSDPHSSVWRVLGPLLQLHLHRAEGDGALDDVGALGDAQRRTARGASQLSKSPIVQLASLVLHDDVGAAYKSAWGADSTDADAAEQEVMLKQRCAQVLRTLRPIEPALSDWSKYMDILMAEEDVASEMEALFPVTLYLMCEAATITNDACDALIDSDQQSNDDESDDDDEEEGNGTMHHGKSGSMTARGRKEAAEMQQARIALSAHLEKALGPLLQRFGTHALTLRATLSLVQQLRLSCAQATLKGKRLEEILTHLEAATVKHTDVRTLAACGNAWQSLLHQEGAPALTEVVTVRYHRLVAKSLGGVRELSHALKSKSEVLTTEMLRDAGIVLRRLELITKHEAQSVPQLVGIADRLLALAQRQKFNCFEAYDLFQRNRHEFEAHAKGIATEVAAPEAKRARGRTGVGASAPRKDKTSAVDIAKHGESAVFAGRLFGCLASLIRLQSAQLVHQIEHIVEIAPKSGASQTNPPKARKRGAGPAPRGDQNETKQIVREFVAARRRLLPTLCSIIDLPSQSLQQLALESISTLLSPLSVYANYNAEYALEEEVESDEDADFVDEGGWLVVLQNAMVEGIRSLFTSLASAGDGASGPCHDDTLAPVASDDQGVMQASHTYGALWLRQCILAIAPQRNILPPPRVLALLLAAPESAKGLALPELLTRLWRAYRHSRMPLEEQGELFAHVLVSACQLLPFRNLQSDTNNDVDQQIELGPAAAAASTLAQLHEVTYTSEAKSVGDKLLVTTILRGLRWAFSQSDSALASDRGAWIDAALVHLVRLLSADGMHKVGEALRELSASVESAPKCPKFEETIGQTRGSRMKALPHASKRVTRARNITPEIDEHEYDGTHGHHQIADEGIDDEEAWDGDGIEGLDAMENDDMESIGADLSQDMPSVIPTYAHAHAPRRRAF